MISQYSALEARLSYSAPFAASLCCTSGRSRSRRKQLQCSPTRAQDEQSGDGQRKVQSSGPVRVPPLLGPADVRRDTAHILANVTSPEAVEEAARQKFLGRLAVVLLGAVLLGERITGQGFVQQLDLATSIPIWEQEPIVGLLVVGLLIGGLYPNKQGLAGNAARKGGDRVRDLIQAVSGRFACLALAATMVLETVTGKGALALLNIETGIETLPEIEAIVAFLVVLFLTEDVKTPSAE
ncbi:hypothetical protein WJX84_003614 [Apatococcus fuscideae]|uniref:Uncharacterized protein n=1 Tax=Apatococcus fuscideae TaxID=2026836 RepID=A0AAW1TH81_9CHLO